MLFLVYNFSNWVITPRYLILNQYRPDKIYSKCRSDLQRLKQVHKLLVIHYFANITDIHYLMFFFPTMVII